MKNANDIEDVIEKAKGSNIPDNKRKMRNIANDVKNSLQDNIVDKMGNLKYFKHLNMVSAEKKFFMFITFALALVVIVQSYLLMDLSGKSRTIVLPPQVSKEFWVTDKQLSETYFEQVSYFIADRVLSVSPETAPFVYPSLMPFFGTDAKELSVIENKLKEQADFVKRENLYQIFYPIKMEADYRKKELRVRGNLRKYVGQLFVQEIKDADIRIQYDIVSGKFIIKNLMFEYR